MYVENNHFRVFISEDDNNCFYSGCLWYEGKRALKAPGQSGALSFALETRVDTTEKEALNQILNWIKSKFGPNFKLEESK